MEIKAAMVVNEQVIHSLLDQLCRHLQLMSILLLIMILNTGFLAI